MLKPSRTRGQGEGDLPKPSGGKGSVWLASCPFACGGRGRGGLEWISAGGWRSLRKESEGGRGSYASIELTIVTGSGGCASPFLAGCHPAHEQRREAALICQKRLQRFTSTWSGKSHLRCSWYLGWGELAPRGWSFSKMRAWGGLRGRLGAYRWFPRKKTQHWLEK